MSEIYLVGVEDAGVIDVLLPAIVRIDDVDVQVRQQLRESSEVVLMVMRGHNVIDFRNAELTYQSLDPLGAATSQPGVDDQGVRIR